MPQGPSEGPSSASPVSTVMPISGTKTPLDGISFRYPMADAPVVSIPGTPGYIGGLQSPVKPRMGGYQDIFRPLVMPLDTGPRMPKYIVLTNILRGGARVTKPSTTPVLPLEWCLSTRLQRAISVEMSSFWFLRF